VHENKTVTNALRPRDVTTQVMTAVNSAFYPSRVGISSTSLSGWD